MQPVSAIMITGKDQGRRRLALAAVSSFQLQTYPEKELVIVNDGEPLYPAGTVPSGVREIMVHTRCRLGTLRNIGLEHARGRYVVQWDDDDWSHPARMAYQMSAVTGDRAVLLLRQVRYSFVTDTAFVFTWPYRSPPAIPGTILHPHSPGIRYREDLERAEDDWFIRDHFPTCVLLDNTSEAGRAHYYLRFAHGANTWSEDHIIGKHFSHTGRWRLTTTESDYLQEVLGTYYQRTG